MSGLRKMLIEQTNVIDAHRMYVKKINPNTAHREE
jgi:hypothetical protein